MKSLSFVLLLLTLQEAPRPDPAAVETCLTKVRAIHGTPGPWAVAGYRLGQRALKELNLPAGSVMLVANHFAPARVQFSCMVDGVQAATGASLGKLNLKLTEAPVGELRTEFTNKKSGVKLIFRLRPEFMAAIRDLPPGELEAAGRRVASLPDDEIFVIERAAGPTGP
jgi:formylmethanofuran dehydrogenase subunit E